MTCNNCGAVLSDDPSGILARFFNLSNLVCPFCDLFISSADNDKIIANERGGGVIIQKKPFLLVVKKTKHGYFIANGEGTLQNPTMGPSIGRTFENSKEAFYNLRLMLDPSEKENVLKLIDKAQESGKEITSIEDI